MTYYINGNKSQDYMTAAPEKYPQGYFKEKPCRWCKTEFKPQAPSHLFCSDVCASWSKTQTYLKKMYGLSVEEYEKMLEDQDYKCAICRTAGFKLKVTNRQSIVVDHCHSSGKVRGLLCHNCNRGLGLFQDNIDHLLEAAKYIQNNR